MGWATHYIQMLKRGETVQFRPRGSSMKGKVESGQLCTVAPFDRDPAAGDIVLCKVRGREYLHIVKAVRKKSYLICNAKGHVNGWIGRQSIFGRLVSVETEGEERWDTQQSSAGCSDSPKT